LTSWIWLGISAEVDDSFFIEMNTTLGEPERSSFQHKPEVATPRIRLAHAASNDSFRRVISASP
jgi:hypothetical protein